MAGNEYVLKPPKEVQRKSATNPNIAARVGAELAQSLRAFCTENRVTMESAMQVAIAEFLERRTTGGER
jgi:hypothetical protein